MANLIIGVYSIYLVFMTAATIYTARTLFSNSKTFMKTIFAGRDELAIATNKLFETGFFLLAFGIGLWHLKTYRHIWNNQDLFEVLSVKMGGFTLFLGILLFFNLYLFFRGMKHRRRTPEMPVPPSLHESQM